MELARRAGVARGTAQARLDRLVARGVVRGFGPEIDPPSLGYPVLAFTTLEIAQAGVDELVAHLVAIPEVLEVHTITGPGDLLCRIVARSNDHLQAVIAAVLAGPSINRAVDPHRPQHPRPPPHRPPGRRRVIGLTPIDPARSGA